CFISFDFICSNSVITDSIVVPLSPGIGDWLSCLKLIFCLFFAYATACSYLFLTVAFHLYPQATEYLYNNLHAFSKASNCVFPLPMYSRTVSARNKSSSLDQASCRALFFIHSLLYSLSLYARFLHDRIHRKRSMIIYSFLNSLI